MGRVEQGMVTLVWGTAFDGECVLVDGKVGSLSSLKRQLSLFLTGMLGSL